MPNNIFEQIEELYSRWSILDKVGKEMQLERSWQQLTSAYNYLVLVFQSKGYLTPNEINNAKQISQMLMAVQNQKIKVDQELTNEMNKHIAKMISKQ